MSDGQEGEWRTTVLPCGHEVLKADQAHYCTYVSVDALEKLRQPFAGTPTAERIPHTHNEELFVACHQASEIAFGHAVIALQLTTHSLRPEVALSQFVLAKRLLGRSIAWVNVATEVMFPLRTMADFKGFRDSLAPASGAESLNVRRLEILAGVRENTPYVVERGVPYTYREYLDRRPKDGDNDPKTRWWTEELTQLLQQPSLQQRLHEQIGLQGLDLETACEGLYPLPLEVPTVKKEEDEERLSPREKLRELCRGAYIFEMAYLNWRMHHSITAAREIGTTPGTGHTSGMTYLHDVRRRLRIFPGLSEAIARQDPASAPPATGT